jgi:hypothetical protein
MDAKHLDRYLAEFDFRQNTRAKLGINDEQRATLAVKGMKGNRLATGFSNATKTRFATQTDRPRTPQTLCRDGARGRGFR